MLEVKGISRKTLADESGYNVVYINGLLTSRAISPKAERNLRAAMKRIEEDPDEDLGNILVKLYCVDNEHLMRTIFDGILRIQGIATTETNISLQEVFQREVNIDFIDE